MTSGVENAIQQLLNQRNQLATDVEVLSGRIAGLDTAIQILSAKLVADEVDLTRRKSVTELLVALLTEAGPSGLNARIVMKIAAERGVSLNEKSISSTLSRLKKEGVIVYEDHRYKLRASLLALKSNVADQKSEAG